MRRVRLPKGGRRARRQARRAGRYAAGSRRHEKLRAHRIADIQQAATVDDARKWQAAVFRDRLEQQEEISLYARAVRERQAQYDAFDRCPLILWLLHYK